MAKSKKLVSSLFLYVLFLVLSVFSARVVFADEAPQTLDELKAAIEKVRVETN